MRARGAISIAAVLTLAAAFPATAMQSGKTGKDPQVGTESSQQTTSSSSQAANSAPQDTSDSRSATQKLDVRFGFGLDYETNAANLSDDSIDVFDSGDFVDDRFVVSSVQDAIWAPTAQLTWSRTPANRRVTRAYVSFVASRHVENGIKDFALIRVSFDQFLTDGRADLEQLARERREWAAAESTEDERRDLSASAVRARRSFMLANSTRIRGRVYHTTDRKLGLTFNRDVGDRRENSVHGNTALVTWEQRLNRGDENRFRLDLTYRRDWSDYAADFDERDSTADRFTVGINYFRQTLPSNAYWQLGAAYERGIRNSNTDVIGTRGPAGVIVEDFSRDDNTFYFVAGRFWYRTYGDRALGRSNSLRFRARYGLSDYASLDPRDTSHFLRNDDRYRIDVDYRHPIRDWAMVRAGVAYEARNARFDAAAGREDRSPFNNFGAALGVIFYFDLWRSAGR